MVRCALNLVSIWRDSWLLFLELVVRTVSFVDSNDKCVLLKMIGCCFIVVCRSCCWFSTLRNYLIVIKWNILFSLDIITIKKTSLKPFLGQNSVKRWFKTTSFSWKNDLRQQSCFFSAINFESVLNVGFCRLEVRMGAWDAHLRVVVADDIRCSIGVVVITSA